MHELSIAEGIIEIVERTARANNVKAVSRVRIAIGELAGVDLPSLEFAWESVRKGGPAEKAVLDVTRPPGEAWCLACARTVPLSRYGDPCPLCGGFQLAATGGTEMRVVELIEAQDPNDACASDDESEKDACCESAGDTGGA